MNPNKDSSGGTSRKPGLFQLCRSPHNAQQEVMSVHECAVSPLTSTVPMRCVGKVV
jgi:hypothetical protein